MIKEPKFSIIIPVYNVENYLSECLDSVIKQTVIDLEIICVNDGTKDHSRAILEEYQKLDPRIQIIDKENGGLSSARNAGLMAATGEYILFLDSDDYLEECACERILYEILEHHPDIVVFGTHIFPYYPWPTKWHIRNLTTRTTAYWNDGVNALMNENGSTPFVWRDCFKREFLNEYHILFNDTVRYGEDIIFQFEAFPHAASVIFISDKLYHYRWSRAGSLMAAASKDMYKKYSYHIDAMQIIADYWKEHGLLDRYGNEFFAWTVSFIGWDLFDYSGEAKEILIKRACEFWDVFELGKYMSGLTAKNKVYYTYIRNYPTSRSK